MILLLAPSKTLDFETQPPVWAPHTRPEFLKRATQIVTALAEFSSSELQQLMNVSETIAKTNHTRLTQWGSTSKQALWAYKGDVYKGMYADNLTLDDASWAQEHLIILSGLYGVLRPYDDISAYRLEMKARLPVNGCKDLYEFWGNRLAEYIDERSSGVICNLSSDEYARPVVRSCSSRVITPIFMDNRPNGTVGPAPIYNKMMRGVMAHWMVKNQIDEPLRLPEFSAHGYVYDTRLSKKNAPVFRRNGPMKPLVF